MSHDDQFVLTSAVNLSNGGEAICIPLFMKYPENAPFIGICSDDFSIIDFQPFHDFERYQFRLPGDQDVPYTFCKGDKTPLVIMSKGLPVILHSEEFELLVRLVKDHSQCAKDIFDELAQNLTANLSIDFNKSANDEVFLSGDWSKDDFTPRPAKFWLDETIRNIRLMQSSESPNDLEASAARLRLLNWAKEYGENATSGLFRHFIDLVRVVEQNGVFARDLLAVALIRRMSEEVTRQQTVTNLIGSFRSRYKRSPASFAVELATKNDGPFSERAKQVLDMFYANAKNAIAQNDIPRLLIFAYAVDDENLWSPEVISLLRKKTSRLEEQLRSLLVTETEKLEELSKVRKALQKEGTIYRRDNHPKLKRLRELRDQISASKLKIHESTQLIDILFKAKEGLDLENSNIDLAVINYKRLGLNPSFFDTVDQEIIASEPFR